MVGIRFSCCGLDYSSGSNQNAARTPRAPAAPGAPNLERLAGGDRHSEAGLSWGPVGAAADFGKYDECSIAPARLQPKRGDGSWLQGDGLDAAERVGEMER